MKVKSVLIRKYLQWLNVESLGLFACGGLVCHFAHAVPIHPFDESPDGVLVRRVVNGSREKRCKMLRSGSCIALHKGLTLEQRLLNFAEEILPHKTLGKGPTHPEQVNL